MWRVPIKKCLNHLDEKQNVLCGNIASFALFSYTDQPCWRVECPTDPPPSAPGSLPLTDAAGILQQLKWYIRRVNTSFPTHLYQFKFK